MRSFSEGVKQKRNQISTGKMDFAYNKRVNFSVQNPHQQLLHRLVTVTPSL